MAKSRRWSNTSAPCRLEWRPSRPFAAALAVLVVLACVALVASELPLFVSLLLAGPTAMYGGWLARREWCRSVHELVVPPGEGVATIDGLAMDDLRVEWRGALAVMCWQDAQGRRQRLHGWPGSLDAASRRELRLAMAARVPAPAPRTMAP